MYILRSTKYDWYYVGSTQNIENRLRQHNHKEVRSTKFRAPYVLVYTEHYEILKEARLREKELKQKRVLKEKIIKHIGPIV